MWFKKIKIPAAYASQMFVLLENFVGVQLDIIAVIKNCEA